MKRNITANETIELIARIRNIIPDIALRTTLITGYPGETERDFEQLADFVEKTRFDRLGVFTYSQEEHTSAAKQRDNIPEKIKQQRADHIMDIQRRISEELNQQKVGKTFKVIIDGVEGNHYIGRTEYDSPEVDTEVLIPLGNKLKIGEFYNVVVNNATEFDLYGTTC
jgi:ribosomal protein S12 methylthiotransferase